jgi:hypothetical protein
MYKQDSVRQILEDYKITITGSKVKRQYDATPVSSHWDQYMDYSVIPSRDVTMITADMPEKEFTAMADALCEMRDLMRDPETAKLLMEARFINRLKGKF